LPRAGDHRRGAEGRRHQEAVPDVEDAMKAGARASRLGATSSSRRIRPSSQRHFASSSTTTTRPTRSSASCSHRVPRSSWTDGIMPLGKPTSTRPRSAPSPFSTTDQAAETPTWCSSRTTRAGCRPREHGHHRTYPPGDVPVVSSALPLTNFKYEIIAKATSEMLGKKVEVARLLVPRRALREHGRAHREGA